jgi:uncharacterized membrane protein YkvA (DUF1232 family)
VLKLLLGLGVALAVTWVLLLVGLALARPKGPMLREGMRLLPDLLRLLPRLARDPAVPRGVRVRLWLLLGYLALPLDLVPDFIPVLGYADDVIAVVWVLRSVTRHAGPDAVRRNWPGTDDGLAALVRLCGLDPASEAADPNTGPRRD